MKKNNLLIKLLTLLIIIAAVLPVFYMPAYAVEEEYGTQDISDHGISEQGENITSSESETSYVEEGNNVFDIVPKGYTLKAVQTRSVLPILTSSSLKTEKNYTVIILEKLASLAIQVGKDIVSVIRLRNFYIKKVEEQTEFVGVLATRDSAIIHFTEELHGVSNQARTSLIRCVLQYINLKIYDNIKVTELAKQFYLSESALRSRFKEEIGVPINEYVNKRKIEESKMMIWSGIPAGEIARRLSFYDLSHYYRTFKKYTGVTPQQFRDTNIIGQEM